MPIQSLLGPRAIDRCRAHDCLRPSNSLVTISPLPRPHLTALQRCTTKNPRTTRHSGMKRGIFPQNPGSREVGLNSGKSACNPGSGMMASIPGKSGILGRYRACAGMPSE